MQKVGKRLKKALLFGNIATAVLFGWVSPVGAQTVKPVVADDTFLSQEWHLDAIHAREGWSSSIGSSEVVVAVIDSGVDIDHEDLRANVWTNPKEIAGNGKDDDKNGYVDDVHGWNFVSKDPDVRPSSDPNGIEGSWIHGTVVSSLIGGVGNNDVGIAGVAWRVRIMPLVVLDAEGNGRDENLIAAVRYAMMNGADIINFSLVGYEYDPKLADAIHEATAKGVLVVSASGNSETNIEGENLDVTPGYPACDKGASDLGQLTVTAIDRSEKKIDRANYGSCVDVSAPGGGLFAARPTHDFFDPSRLTAGYVGGLSGTSLAAPLVSGLAALLKAEHPEWRGQEIAQRIKETADPIDDKNPKYAGGLGRGRINVLRAVTNDARSEALGPLTLQGSRSGMPPEIRVLTSSGTELRRFAVGATGDRRGVRATFVRWQKLLEPDIAVTMIGDPTGAWRVYRPDGLLIAAGELGAFFTDDPTVSTSTSRGVLSKDGWLSYRTWPY